jgi:hypothetical protein
MRKRKREREIFVFFTLMLDFPGRVLKKERKCAHERRRKNLINLELKLFLNLEEEVIFFLNQEIIVLARG